MRATEADYGGGIRRVSEAYGRSPAGLATDGLSVEVWNETLSIAHPDGFILRLPLHRIRELDVEDRGATGDLILRIVANPAGPDNTLQLDAVLPYRPDRARDREELLRFRDRVGGPPEPARAEPEPPTPPAEVPRPAAERPAPRTPVRPPFVPICGPALNADPKNEDWLVLQPLADTVALSRGKLLVPEESPDR